MVALLSALHAIATGRVDTEPTAAYDGLPENRDIEYDLLLPGGYLVLEGAEPIRADVAIVFDDSSARTGARFGEIGDLADAVAVDTLQVDGLFLHVEPDATGAVHRGGRARLTIRSGPGPDSELVRELGDGTGIAGPVDRY